MNYDKIWQIANRTTIDEFSDEMNGYLVNTARDIFDFEDKNVNLLKKLMFETTGIEFSEIYKKNRNTNIKIHRHVFNYILVKRLLYTNKRAGLVINRDHTTVIHSCRVVKDMIDTGDKLLSPYIDILEFEFLD